MKVTYLFGALKNANLTHCVLKIETYPVSEKYSLLSRILGDGMSPNPSNSECYTSIIVRPL
jgi:hypothetical protein